MKKKGIGIFAKIFFYTIFLILVVIPATLVVFFKQAIEFYNVSKYQKVRETFVSFQERLEGKSYDEVKIIAEQFHKENLTFEFALHDQLGLLLFATPMCMDILEPDEEGWNLKDNHLKIDGKELDMNLMNFNPADKKLGLLAFYPEYGPAYLDFFKMSAFILMAVLIISSIGAAIFAKLITDPIKNLAKDARKMSMFEPVLPPPIGYDEIGQLREDVHQMYQKLKTTISDLELEMSRRAQMEESQRYFFSAASHELKTPIAATNALLEGMLDNIGDYKNHPKYIVECLKLMNTQTKLVNEILDIVKLTDNEITLKYEKIKLNEVISELLPPYMTLIEHKSQKIKINIPKGSFCIVDKKMFVRVFCNILMNGIQNSKEGETIELWCEDKEKSVRLNILNTGVNIEEDIVEKLFEPFYRVDSARSRKDGRSGIGLTLTKKLLDIMGISFELCNTKKGVLFWLELSKVM